MTLEISGSITLDEEARRQFEEAWRQGQPQEIEKSLPLPTDPRYLPTLEELVQIELEFRWRDRLKDPKQSEFPDESLLVESYLQRFPCLDQPAVVLRLLEHERHVRSLFGDRPDPDDYQRRFPHLMHTGEGIGGTLPGAQRGFEERPEIPGYEVLALLGRGGMGVVYKARQTSLNRLVALKMILAGADYSAAEVSRFRREAEAVARLQHPNIVQIHDVGEIRGRPYFSMELIEGGSLAERLGGTPQSARWSAEFVEVLARAVDHAHRVGVVHRDLKPANILLVGSGIASGEMAADTVTGQPAHGSPTAILRSPLITNQPKITDFGLAKILDSEDGQTTTGTPLGTPSYMAPEQAIGKRDEIGPATDVYGLGAVLYEMLTGRPPFKAETPLGTLEQVRTQEPVSPSRLQPKIPRDLITICLKCLEKDPRRRYASAEALADDLRRFLDAEPIHARPTAAWERTWKWVKRHPAITAVAMAGATSIVVIIAIIASSNARLQEQRDIAEQKSREAQEQRDVATANLRKARAAVDRLTQLAQTELADVPKVAPIRRRLLEEALQFYEELTAQAGDDPQMRFEVARAHRWLAACARILGRFEQAKTHYRKAAVLIECLAADFPATRSFEQELSTANYSLGVFLQSAEGRQFPAPSRDIEGCFRRAIAIGEKLAAEDATDAACRADLAEAYNGLGTHLEDMNRHEDAMNSQRRAHTLIEDAVQRDPSNADYTVMLLKIRNNLAAITKDPQEAEKLFRQNKVQGEKALEHFPDNIALRSKLALSCWNLGGTLAELGKISEAKSILYRAVELREKLLDDSLEEPYPHRALGTALSSLAQLLVKEGNYTEACRHLKRAVAHCRTAVNMTPASQEYREIFCIVLALLADTLIKLGEHSEAAKVAVEFPQIRPGESEECIRAAVFLGRCATLAKDAKLPPQKSAELVRGYGDQAVALLRQAKQHGFKDASSLRKDPSLDIFRDRKDFQSLVDDLAEKRD
jgi:serine/threonine protein kinase/tetratricopeptide (TPR) repeat protein